MNDDNFIGLLTAKRTELTETLSDHPNTCETCMQQVWESGQFYCEEVADLTRQIVRLNIRIGTCMLTEGKVDR